MLEIADLERRITNALDRAIAGVEALGKRPPSTDEGAMDALKNALTEEQTVSAQLEERVRVIKERQETNVRDLENQMAELTNQVEHQLADMTRLKQVNTQLRDSNRALREANAAGLGDADLINKATLDELAALRAMRASEQSEVEALIRDLKPLVGEGV